MEGSSHMKAYDKALVCLNCYNKYKEFEKLFFRKEGDF
jgi:hypothetical protein